MVKIFACPPCPGSLCCSQSDQSVNSSGAHSQNSGLANFQNSVPGNPVVSMPATNLNIGMDLWNASSGGSGAMNLRPSQPGVSPTVAPSQSGMMNDHWIPVC